MKPGLLLFLFCLLIMKLHAQCPNNTWNPPLKTDSLDFDHPSLHIRYQIDTSLAGNCWQIGTVSKLGLLPAFSPAKALQTDTTQPYPVNQVAAFYCWPDSQFNGFYNFASLSFRHHYDVDSLKDSLLVQFSIDSGKHWLDPPAFIDSAQALGFFGFVMDYQGIRWDSLHPNYSHKILFTGSDTGWTQVSICFTFLAFKPARIIDSARYAVRFLMISDSVQQNKPGWEIDDIHFLQPGVVGAVSDYSILPVSIYPMPSASGEFSIDTGIPDFKGLLTIWDPSGRYTKSFNVENHFSIAELPDGLYFFSLNDEIHHKQREGKLLKY